MVFIGIDPGTTHSGYAVVDSNYSIIKSDKVINEGAENSIISLLTDAKSTDIILIESIQSRSL